MESFKIVREIGSGAYGRVFQAVHKTTGEIVAIKKLKHQYSRAQSLNLREVKSMRQMNHQNVMKLTGLINVDGDVYYVFPYMEGNLLEVMKFMCSKVAFTEDQVRDLMFQALLGLEHIHQRGYFHRDIKPENLLVTSDYTVKISDFGFAREIDCKLPLTEPAGTQWYLSPEQLLGAKEYGSAVDMWAMGATMAELFLRSPVFPATTTAQQLEMICTIIGSPTKDDWPESLALFNAGKYVLPDVSDGCLPMLFPPGFVSHHAIQLIRSLLSWDPSKRPTASEALKHPFFQRSSSVRRSGAGVGSRNHNNRIEPQPFVPRYQPPGRIRMN